MSLVEVSESTVTLLKLLLTAAVRACDRSGAARGASVVMTAIMVAMFGMIMPAPLHIPPTVKVTPGYPMPLPEKLTEPCLGQVSVVMMARAAVRPWDVRPARSSATFAMAASAAGTPSAKGSRRRCWPITPVEATSTSSAGQPTASPTSSAVLRAFSKPISPVAAFAMPELTTTARAHP